jgi:hypothetical protein
MSPDAEPSPPAWRSRSRLPLAAGVVAVVILAVVAGVLWTGSSGSSHPKPATAATTHPPSPPASNGLITSMPALVPILRPFLAAQHPPLFYSSEFSTGCAFSGSSNLDQQGCVWQTLPTTTTRDAHLGVMVMDEVSISKARADFTTGYRIGDLTMKEHPAGLGDEALAGVIRDSETRKIHGTTIMMTGTFLVVRVRNILISVTWQGADITRGNDGAVTEMRGFAYGPGKADVTSIAREIIAHVR